ncbi:MAG: hypothetical protein R3253_01500, partial [Longimicrobiales bacterium]|nr:hypothetical protein [Longimicrobiales bacterium]
SAGAGTSTVLWTFNNSDTLDVQTDTIDVGGAFIHDAGAVIRGSGRVVSSSASAPTLAGDLAPGTSPGILQLRRASLTQEATGTLTVELGGTTAGTEYDRLEILGDVTLQGDLLVDTINGFVPSGGDRFAVMTFGARTGSFANVVLPDLSASGITLDTVWAEAGARDTLYIEASGGGAPLVRWTNAAGGLWSTGSNWSTGSPPAAGDSAVIDLDGTYTVSLSQGAQVAHLAIGAPSGAQTLELLAGANLTLDGRSEVLTNGVLSLSGGTVAGGDSLLVSGSLDWQQGFQVGPGVTVVEAGGSMTLSGAGTKDFDGRTVENRGTVTWGGNGVVRVQNTPATFNNLAGGTFDIQGAGTWRVDSGSGSFVNSGVVTKSAGVGISEISWAFDNDGSVEVQADTLRLAGGGTSSGSYSVSAGAKLDYAAGNHTLLAASAITGPGTVANTVVSSVTTVGGSYDVGRTEALNGVLLLNTPDSARTTDVVHDGGNVGGSGVLRVAGTYSWVGGNQEGTGVTAIMPGATMSLSGADTKRFDGRTVDNFGTTTWAGTGVVLVQNNPATFNNRAGGTFDVQSSAVWRVDSGGGSFTNAGLVVKTVGTGRSDIDWNFTNSDTLDVQTDTIDFGGSFSHAAGAVLRGNGRLALTGGPAPVVDGDIAPGTSPGRLELRRGSVQQSPSSTLTIELAGTTPGTGYDQLNFTGDWVVDGPLVVDTLSGFVPTAGDRFAIATFTSRTGTFTNVTLPAITGVALDTVWAEAGTADTLYLEATATGGAPLVQWTNANGGLWSNGANWSAGSPPAAGDSAVIDLDGTYTVTLDVAADVGWLIVDGATGSQTLSQSGGILAVTDGAYIGPNGTYELSNTGELTGAAVMTIDGLLDWTGGTMSGSGATVTTPAGGLSISGAATRTLRTRALQIGGLATWIEAGTIEHDGSPTITIGPSGELDIQGDGVMLPTTVDVAALDVLGSLVRTVSTGSTTLSGVSLSNAGTVDVQSGTLAFSDFSGAGSSDGSFTVADGSFLGLGAGSLTASASVTGEGTVFFLDGGGTVDIAGSVNVDSLAISTTGATANVTGSYLVGTTIVAASGATLTLSTADTARSDVVAIADGTLTGTAPVLALDTLLWLGGTFGGSGTLILDDLGYAEVGGPTVKTSTKPLFIEGTLDILAGTLDQDADFTLDTLGFVQGDGVLDLSGATVLGWYGDMSPGTSPGQLDIVSPGGGLFMDPVSVTFIDIEGTLPGTGYDLLEFGGGASFAGDLVVDTVFGGFVPAPGDTFPVITVDGPRTGVFANVTVPTFTGLTLDTAWASGVSADTLYLLANGHPLVFSSQRAGNGSLDIWTQSEDGTSTSRLTSSSLNDVGAHWSPDGSQITFYRDDGAAALIYLMDDDGSNLVQLSASQSNHRDPDWSASGDTIVFTLNDGAQDEIWLMLKDGTGLTPVTDAPNSNEFDPVVSPDGTRVLYVTDVNVTDEDIWVADFPSGANATEVTSSAFDEGDPEWAPDGSQIVFVRNSNGNEDVWIVDVDGSGLPTAAPTQLTSDAGQDWLPVFSPDGTEIYWMSDRTGNFEVWVMNRDGTNQRQLTNDPGVDGAPDVRR